MTPSETSTPEPSLPGSVIADPSFRLGFLTILQDAQGILGGYLLTNSWGRPLEFRLSTAVQPNKVQQILYGPTLHEYLHADLIGKALIERTSVPPTLILTDSLAALPLRSRMGWPILALTDSEADTEQYSRLPGSANMPPLYYLARHADEESMYRELLQQVDGSVDLSEPFARVREAVYEARKQGASRVA